MVSRGMSCTLLLIQNKLSFCGLCFAVGVVVREWFWSFLI